MVAPCGCVRNYSLSRNKLSIRGVINRIDLALYRLLVKQEVSRKLGLALTPEEEELRTKLETLYSKINAPTQFKGRLSELLSQIRMVKQEVAQKEVEKYTMDEIVQDEVRQYLAMEQNGMAQLINIIQADMADLTTIKNGMMRMLQGN
uniref:Uncharacterized protein n=1 Tax=Timema douglasi TaxID=61478 RepID=A0A7R8VYK3_TIMDO|nr:unnamed protein product [Timema douglasi]